MGASPKKALLTIFSVICIIFCNCRPSFSSAIPPVRAVNLGGWLVTEGWIKPSLFHGIPNNDFLVIHLNSVVFPATTTIIIFQPPIFNYWNQDGTGLQFKSVTVEKYLCAELGGGSIVVANRTAASGWETFRVFSIITFGIIS